MRELSSQETGLVAGGAKPPGSTHITVVVAGGNGGKGGTGGAGGAVLNAGTGGNGIGSTGGNGTATWNGGQSTYNFGGGTGGDGGSGAPAITLGGRAMA